MSEIFPLFFEREENVGYIGMVVANVTRDAQNYLTDNYSLVTDTTRIENLVRNAIIEFNKEKPQIHFPLYPVRSSPVFSSLFKSRLLVLFGVIVSSLSHDWKC